MIIRGKNFTVDTREHENAMTFGDLKPGDVFSYVRGREDNIYVKGVNTIFLLSSNREIIEEIERIGRSVSSKSPVILYPDAELLLGTPRREKPAKEGEK